MEDEIKNKLGTSLFKSTNSRSGGCISQGSKYLTDNGEVFIKTNHKDGADIMFKGEYFGLKALDDACLRVPKPFCYGKNYLVCEFVNISPLFNYSEQLGQNLALLHRGSSADDNRIGAGNLERIEKFGFDNTTCCGFVPLNNEWHSDWINFYVTQRLQPLVKTIEKDYSNREVSELFSQLIRVIPAFFKDIKVVPSLLHGDLWSGNAGETDEGPIVFDPATFYGHDEFDLAIAKMFGGFSSKFFNAYHNILPQQPGFKERSDLYLLFHHLNHWVHFGEGYSSSSISLMKKLIKDR